MINTANKIKQEAILSHNFFFNIFTKKIKLKQSFDERKLKYHHHITHKNNN